MNLALYDSLTGLPNVTLLGERLTQAAADARREGSHVAVLRIELAGIERIRQFVGHARGEWVLKEAAARISRAVRSVDTVARIGGDELVVVCVGLPDAATAEARAAELLAALQAPFTVADGLHRLAVRIGLTLYPDDARDLDGLLRRANEALHLARRSGRSCFTRFMPGTSARRPRADAPDGGFDS